MTLFLDNPDLAKYVAKNCNLQNCCAVKTHMGTFKSWQVCNKSYYFYAPFMGNMFSSLSVRPASGYKVYGRGSF